MRSMIAHEIPRASPVLSAESAPLCPKSQLVSTINIRGESAKEEKWRRRLEASSSTRADLASLIARSSRINAAACREAARVALRKQSAANGVAAITAGMQAALVKLDNQRRSSLVVASICEMALSGLRSRVSRGKLALLACANGSAHI